MNSTPAITSITSLLFKALFFALISLAWLSLASIPIHAQNSGVGLNLSSEPSSFNSEDLEHEPPSNHIQDTLSTPTPPNPTQFNPGQASLDSARTLLAPGPVVTAGSIAGSQDEPSVSQTSSTNPLQQGASVLLIILVLAAAAYFIPKKIPPPAKLTPQLFKTAVWAVSAIIGLAALYFILLVGSGNQSLDTRSDASFVSDTLTATSDQPVSAQELTAEVTGYESFRLGYAINIPDDWSVDDSRSNLPGDLFIHPSGKAVVMIQDFDDVRGQTPEGKQQLIDEFQLAIQGSNQFITDSIEQTTHQGYDAVHATGTRIDSGGTWTYEEYTIFFDTGKFLRLHRMVTEGFEEQYQPAINRVADSITITNPSSTRDRLVTQVKTIEENPICVNDLGTFENASISDKQSEAHSGCTVNYQVPAGTNIVELEDWYAQNAAANGWQLLEGSLKQYINTSNNSTAYSVFAMAKCSDSAFDQEAIVKLNTNNSVEVSIVTLPRDNSVCTVQNQPIREQQLDQESARQGLEVGGNLSQTFSGLVKINHPQGWKTLNTTDNIDIYDIQTSTTSNKQVPVLVVESPDGNAAIRVISSSTQTVELPKEGVEAMFSSSPVNVKSVSTTSFAGKRAVQMTYSEDGVDNYGIFVVINGSFYNLVAKAKTGSWDTYKPVLLEMLRSISL